MVIASSFAAFEAFAFVLLGLALIAAIGSLPFVVYGVFRKKLFDPPNRWWKVCLMHAAVAVVAVGVAIPLAMAARVSAAHWTTDGGSLFVLLTFPALVQLLFFVRVVVKRPKA